MSIGFICNQNQARSQTLHAYFTTVFRNLEIHSAGLIANENSNVPKSIRSIHEAWGIDMNDPKVQNLDVHWERFVQLEFIFCATDLIADYVKQKGYTGKIINLESLCKEESIDLSDPQLLPRQNTEFELSKLLRVASVGMRKIGKSVMSKVEKSFIPLTEEFTSEAIFVALRYAGSNKLVVYADLVAPISSFNFSQNSQFVYRSEIERFVILEGTESKVLAMPKFALENANRLYLKPQWLKFLNEIESRDVVLVTPPLRTKSGNNPSAYLSSLFSNSLEFVGSG
jgi:protein-tyrosine-phosphatase